MASQTDAAMPPGHLAPRTPATMCPAITGAAILTGRRLRIRHADGELSVTAPPAFLRAALDLCDGTRPVDAILSALPAAIDAERFAGFLTDLLAAGALVDGNLLTAQALQYALQAAPYGRCAPPRETDRLSRRPRWPDGVCAAGDLRIDTVEEAPWMAPLTHRISRYVFADAVMPPGSLSGLLWALCGIVRADHERLGAPVARRTLASAGALHRLQPYVALRRPVDGHAAGVYRVHYPGPRQVALERIGGAAYLMRAFVQPWHVLTATGAVFLAGDIAAAAARYRNRAVQYLYTEAGAALHNGALAATALGLGYATLGCYDEAAVRTLCGTGPQLILGSAVFGPLEGASAPTATSPELEFSWIDTDRLSNEAAQASGPPLHLARARLRRDAPDGDYAWGAAPDPDTAYRKASAEAIERLAWNTPTAPVEGRARDLPGAVDASAFIQYRAAQYRRPGFPFQPFAAARRYHWVRATHSDDGRAALIPVDLVYARPSLVAAGLAVNPPLTYATTSGCAAGATPAEAVERALRELVERDAFMRHWLCQRPGTPLADASLPADIQARMQRLRRLPCHISLQRLDSPWAHVFIVWARDDIRHFTTLGAAAGADTHAALAHALDELESRVLAWSHGHAPTVSHPTAVRTPADHFELYGVRRYYRRADALIQEHRPAIDWRHLPRLPEREAMADRLAAAGLAPVIVDITTPQCTLDHGTRSLHVVKAFAPSLVPLSFGAGLEPLGMVDTVHRHATFPHPFP
ncbi:YcaO-like family protein [Achromobacter ruhlandii]|uniref:YcaO-like family protein n=1 Tax=Achromobacter ruhlandii TaxID=72557 RepID=UPI003BA00D46